MERKDLKIHLVMEVSDDKGQRCLNDPFFIFILFTSPHTLQNNMSGRKNTTKKVARKP